MPSTGDIDNKTDAQKDLTKIDVLTRYEKLLKLATAGLGVVAAIGFPAVAVHMHRFGVPIRTANYSNILRAGVLPATVLLVGMLYCIAASRALAKMSLRQFLAFHSYVVIPLLVPAYLLVFVGLLCFYLIIIWACFWPFRYLLDSVSDISISNRGLLVFSFAFLVIISLVLLLLMLTRRFWINRPGRFWQFHRFFFDTRRRRRLEGSDSDGQTAKQKVQSLDFKWVWLKFLWFLPAPFVDYSVKGVLHIWDPGISSALIHKYLMLGWVCVGVVCFVLIAGIFLNDPKKLGPKDSRGSAKIVATILVFLYIAFEVSYSMWIYPRMHSDLGGGRPRMAVLWLKQEDGAKDISTTLKNVEISSVKGLRQVGNVFIILQDKDNVLLTDEPLGPGRAVLLNKDRIMSISW